MATPDSDDDHAAPERLTMAAFWRDFSDEVFSLARGLPWSFWQLLVRPGQFIRLYIEQLDPRATRPVRYYLVGFVAAALLFEATSPLAELEGLLRSGPGGEGGGAALWLVLQHAELLVLTPVYLVVACLGYFPQPGARRALRAVWASALGFSLSYAVAAAIAVGALQAGKHWPGVFGS